MFVVAHRQDIIRKEFLWTCYENITVHDRITPLSMCIVDTTIVECLITFQCQSTVVFTVVSVFHHFSVQSVHSRTDYVLHIGR